MNRSNTLKITILILIILVVNNRPSFSLKTVFIDIIARNYDLLGIDDNIYYLLKNNIDLVKRNNTTNEEIKFISLYNKCLKRESYFITSDILFLSCYNTQGNSMIYIVDIAIPKIIFNDTYIGISAICANDKNIIYVEKGSLIVMNYNGEIVKKLDQRKTELFYAQKIKLYNKDNYLISSFTQLYLYNYRSNELKELNYTINCNPSKASNLEFVNIDDAEVINNNILLLFNKPIDIMIKRSNGIDMAIDVSNGDNYQYIIYDINKCNYIEYIGDNILNDMMLDNNSIIIITIIRNSTKELIYTKYK